MQQEAEHLLDILFTAINQNPDILLHQDLMEIVGKLYCISKGINTLNWELEWLSKAVLDIISQ